MMDFLFTLIVEPLYFIFEFLFNQIYKISDNILLTIALISFFVSIMCLPLYLRADFLQDEEKRIQEKLSKKVKSIKKNFKGDERLLLLQTYYKQNNYHPIMGLRLALSLLLQIPIFLAAYTFFCDVQFPSGLQYNFIGDLSKPDNLLQVGNLGINILPILMTLVNLIAGFVYTKTISFKENKILITVSLVFLVLLYNAPSALVFYWLFNNIFSLIKNVCLLFLTRENLVKYALVLAIIGYFIFSKSYENIHEIIIVIGLFVILLYLKKTNFYNLNFEYKSIFFLSLLAYWLLVAVYIPSSVVSNSPTEFVFKTVVPFDILYYSAILLAGLILFWGFWIYYFSNTEVKRMLSIIMCIALFSSLLNIFMLKMPEEGILTNLLSYDVPVVDFDFYRVNYKLMYIFLSFVLAYIIIKLLISNKIQVLKKIIFCILITGITISIFNYFSIIKKTYPYLKNYKVENAQIKKYINFSKTSKNIFVIFLDRAISSYFPLVLKEFPELNNKFNGFMYYPNTLSYAKYTLYGYPPILGGYEYTPFRMDEIDDVFENKLYQSTSVLPAIFSQNNWNVDIINPVEKGIEEGHLDDNPYYKKYNINYEKIPRAINDKIDDNLKLNSGNLSKRNMVYYSLLVISSPVVRNFLYDDGKYHNFLNNTFFDFKYDEKLIKSYAELLFLPELTDFSQDRNTFILFNNYLPHSPFLLRYPNYDVSTYNQKDYKPPFDFNGEDYSLKHYHVNVATIKFLGEYFDFLRENNVYDNTRIIIVSDHGPASNIQSPDMSSFESNYYLPYNPLLLVKDFNSNEKLKKSDDVMTNGDVPFIAAKGIFHTLINPYTKKIMTNDDKKRGILIKTDAKWHTKYYAGKKKSLVKEDEFHYVKGTPLEHPNWKINLPYKAALEIHNKQE